MKLMIKIRTSGYRSKSLMADLSLGVFDGLDNALWCYAFASVIFAGALAPFLPVLVAILLCGWALLGSYVALTSEKPVHVVGMDEQAVVILAAIAGLLVAHMGDGVVSPRGISTMLVIMSLSSLAVAVFFWLTLIPLTGLTAYSLLMIAAGTIFVDGVWLRKRWLARRGHPSEGSSLATASGPTA